MPRRFARTGPDFAAGDSVNVMRDFEGNNVLSSRNLFPNMDARDVTQTGELRSIELVQRDQADGWFWYLSQEDGKPHERQSTIANRMNRQAVKLDSGAIRGPQPPSREKAADIIRPSRGVVDLVPIDKLGYKAANYWVGVATVVVKFRDDERFRLISGSCEPIRVTLAQGQGFKMPLPQDEVPAGSVVYVIVMSKPNGSKNELYAQDLVPVGNGVPDFWPMRGPWIRGFEIGSNKTFVGPLGSLAPDPIIAQSESVITLDSVNADGELVAADDEEEQFVPPEIVPEDIPGLTVKMNSGSYTLERGAYRGRCMIRRKYGWTEDVGEPTETVRVYADIPMTSLDFTPDMLPIDTEEWAVSLDYDPDPDADLDEVDPEPPLETEDMLDESVVIASGESEEFAAAVLAEGSVAALVELAAATSTGNPGKRRKHRVGRSNSGAAEVHDGVSAHTGDPKKNQAQSTNYVKPDEKKKQPVGVADPTWSLEAITDDMKFGGAPISPGKKSVVWTWAVDDDESAPSAPTVVTVPAFSGVATHTIRVRRPPDAGEVDNPRFVELEQDELIDSRWERKPNTGVDHVPGDGIVTMTDRTNRATDEDVRVDNSVNVSDNVTRAIKFEMQFLDHTGGAVEARVEFLSKNGAKLGERVVGLIHKRDHHRAVATTFGSTGSGAKWKWPSGTFFIRRVFTHIGSDPDDGVRNFKVVIRGIGQQKGFQHGFKRHPLKEKARNQSRPVVPKAEDDALDYPAFGYACVLDEWDDSPFASVAAAYFDLGFENSGIPQAFTVSKTGGTQIGVTANEPISGKRSLKVADTGATNGRAMIAANLTSGLISEAGHVFLFSPLSVPQNGDVSFYEARNADGTEIARLFMRGLTGRRNKYAQIWLTVLADGGLRTNTLIEDKVMDGDEYIFEMNVTGGGTSGNGRVQVKMGKDNRERSQAANVTGQNFATRRPRRVLIGGDMTTNNPNATWDFRFDDILIHDSGTNAFEKLDARIFEIWSPYKSPVDEIGPQGIKIPVSPLTDYVFSYYIWYRGCTTPSQPFTPTQRASDGTVVREHASALRNVTGRSGWRRVWQRIRTEADTAYVEIGGSYGDGLIRLTAPQFEVGLTPTPYTNKNAAYGYTITTFDMRVPGMPTFWPANHHNEVAKYRRAGHHGTRVAGHQTITISYSSCQDIDVPFWSPWTTNLAAVPPIVTPSGGFRIRAELATDDLTKSPELREVFLDFARRHPVICRGDGQEYFGGMVAVDFQPVTPTRLITERIAADNTESFTKRGRKRRRAVGWWIEGYFDEGAEALMDDQGESIPGMQQSDAGTFLVEDPDIKGGTRFTVRFFNAAFMTESRDVAVDITGVSSPLYFLKAEGIEATVLAEERL